MRQHSQPQPQQPFAEAVAENVIAALQAGQMPWQRQDSAGQPQSLPYNPFNGQRYKSTNALHLAAQGYQDPRWLTLDQANEMGARVRPGEKGTRVQAWKFHDETGARLDKPQCLTAVVFNAQQCKGLPRAFDPPQPDPIERTRGLLAASGASVKEHAELRPTYRASADKIQLPTPEAAGGLEQYASNALRELARWSGHESRLARDLDHPHGSDGAAREALRAEIAGALMADTMGLRYQPASSTYQEAWARLIEGDPLELFRAASDAEAIHKFVMQYDHGQQGAQHQVASVIELGHEQAADAALDNRQRQHLDHVNASIDAAVAEVADPAPKAAKAAPAPAHQPTLEDARSEFAGVMRELGCVLDADTKLAHPVMDGLPHRVKAVGDRGSERSGFYVGHLTGDVPAGFIQNNRTGVKERWKAKGYTISPEDRERHAKEVAAATAKRHAETQAKQAATAMRVTRQASRLKPIPREAPTPYLVAKGVPPYRGVLTDAAGQTTFVPAQDKAGKVWTMQYIGDNGIKRFARDSKKEGCFHVVGGMEALKAAPVIVVGEGYATAATVAGTLKHATVAAFDSGNLEPVARAMRELFPDKPILVAGDDDRAVLLTQGFNPGREKAEAAAKAVGGKAIFPIFAPDEADYPANLPPVTPASYRVHSAAEQRLERGGLSPAEELRARAELLKPEQLQALAKMKEHTDFNDLAQRSSLGRDGLRRQVVTEAHQAFQVTQARAEELKQEQMQAQQQGQGRSSGKGRGHGMRAG